MVRQVIIPEHLNPSKPLASTIEVAEVKGKSRLIAAKSVQPLKILNPSSHSRSCYVVLSSYGGGIVSGDQIAVQLRSHANSSLFLSTQANTKIFQANGSLSSGQVLEAYLEDNSFVVSFPDPVVPQENSNYAQKQSWHLKKNSVLLLADWLHSGRMGIGESYIFNTFFSKINIFKEGKLVVSDSFSFNPKINFADSPANFGGFQTVLSLYLVGFEDEARFTTLSTLLQNLQDRVLAKGENSSILCALSNAREGVYVLRAIAKERADLHPLCEEIMKKLEDEHLLGFNPLERKY